MDVTWGHGSIHSLIRSSRLWIYFDRLLF